MKKLYLKEPSLEDKEEWLNYVKETKEYDKEAKPGGFKDNTIYEEWLKKLNKDSSFYFLMKENRILGSIAIRHNLNDAKLKKFGGHIGYNVRPSERRKGYATKMLYLALQKCKELDLLDVMVTCKKINIGSAKTIEKNYGILKEEIYIKEEDVIFKIYWINVKDALENKQI